MRVADRMTANPVTVTANDTLGKAKALMDAGGFRRLPVVEGDKLVGIITERDLRSHAGYLEATRVNGAMTPAPMTVPSHSSVQDAARLMLEHKVGGMPVVDNGRLVGIVTTSDLLRALLDVVQASGEILSD
jgi:acetoin utilization protein AcuB